MSKRTHEVTLNGNPITLLGPRLTVGDNAPDFTVVDKEMNPVKLSDFAGKIIIINAVPSIDTPVCSAQVRHFNLTASQLSDEVVILSISVDLPFALSRYCAANGIESVKTLSDYRELDFGLKYGFAIETLRLLSRGVVVIDDKNIIRHIEYVQEVTNEPHYDDAINAIKALC